MAVSRFRRRLLYTVSGAAILAGSMLAGWPEGLAISFEDTVFRTATGYYGSVVVKSYDGTQRYIGPPAKLLDYSSPSVKLCRGPDGNLRYGAHNLIFPSEDFSTSWAAQSAGSGLAPVIVSSTDLAPDGTQTATKITFDLNGGTTSGDRSLMARTVVNQVVGVPYNARLWVKGTAGEKIGLRHAAGTTYTIHTFSGEWEILQSTEVSISSSITVQFGLVGNIGVSDSVTCWIWAAHLRRTPSDDTYLKTTDAVVYELPYEWGVNEFVNPSSPETQMISVDDESSYTVVVEGPGSVTLSGAATGTVTADLARTFKMDGTSLTVTVNGSPTFVHVREALGIRVEEQRTNLFLNNRAPVTQNITVTAQAYTLSFYGTGSITLSGAYSDTLEGTGENERVTLTFTPEAGTLTCTVDGDIDFVQLEAGASATSPIVTAGSTVTRAADDISLATSKFPEMGPVGLAVFEGMVPAFPPAGRFPQNWAIDDGANNAIASYVRHTTGTCRLLVRVDGESQADADTSSVVVTPGAFFKTASAWVEDSFRHSVDGQAVEEDTSGSTPQAGTLTTFKFGYGTSLLHRHPIIFIKGLMLVPRDAVSDDELEELAS